MSTNCLRTCVALLISAACVLLTAPSALGQGNIGRESQLKAGYLWFFGHYVEWPDQPFPGSDDKFVIGILGRDTLNGHLQSVARSPINGKKVVLRPVRSAEDYQSCHLLFVSKTARAGDSRNAKQRLEAAVKNTKDAPVLIVSELPQATQQGAAINFVVDLNANRIVLEIDLVHIQRRKLTVSSRLLALERNGVVRIVRRPER